MVAGDVEDVEDVEEEDRGKRQGGMGRRQDNTGRHGFGWMMILG